MKVVRVTTLAPDGLTAQPVLVEVAARPGLSALTIVGLPGRAVAESKDRVRMALRSMGVTLPATNIVINLAPASLRKDGTHYDLPIALALLMAIGTIDSHAIPKNTVVFGELGLDGAVRSVSNAVVLAHHAWSRRLGCILPAANQPSASLLEGLQHIGIQTLEECVNHLQASCMTYTVSAPLKPATIPVHAITLDDVVGQTVAKRAVTIAAAGGHPLFLTGPPGVGKTMLAHTVHALLPALNHQQSVEATLVHGAAGLLSNQSPAVLYPPWRAPHHTTTIPAMVGAAAGSPGEMTLAHRGVLFLDELPLFQAGVIEALREPLQSGTIVSSRVGKKRLWPAEFTLVAAANPCLCGYAGDATKPCQCTTAQRQQYQRRVSGPILDRFGLQIRCTRASGVTGVTGEHQRACTQVAQAYQRQYNRQGCSNGRLASRSVIDLLQQHNLTAKVEQLAVTKDHSMRAMLQIARVGLTLADLNNESLKPCHIEEASFLVPQGLAF